MHNIYFSVPNNTQEFPDFYLNPDYPNENMLEVKAFNYNASPAFDIANFESYCHSVKNKVYRLNADYLIFGYTMNFEGNIKIEKIWLKKIWEIAGNSRRYPLKTQIKRNMIYNIRPNNSFKEGKNSIFKCKEDFLFAIYKTLLDYKGKDFAEFWKENLAENYKEYFGYELNF